MTVKGRKKRKTRLRMNVKWQKTKIFTEQKMLNFLWKKTHRIFFEDILYLKQEFRLGQVFMRKKYEYMLTNRSKVKINPSQQLKEHHRIKKVHKVSERKKKQVFLVVITMCNVCTLDVRSLRCARTKSSSSCSLIESVLVFSFVFNSH